MARRRWTGALVVSFVASVLLGLFGLVQSSGLVRLLDVPVVDALAQVPYSYDPVSSNAWAAGDWGAHAVVDPITVSTHGTSSTRRSPASDRQSVSAAEAGDGAIAFGPGTEKAWSVFNRVAGEKSPFPGYKGGGGFANDGRHGSQILPRTTSGGDPITYQKWDVNPYVKGVDRGGERIVTGNGSAYYNNDHFGWFTQFWGSVG